RALHDLLLALEGAAHGAALQRDRRRGSRAMGRERHRLRGERAGPARPPAGDRAHRLRADGKPRTDPQLGEPDYLAARVVTITPSPGADRRAWSPATCASALRARRRRPRAA